MAAVILVAGMLLLGSSMDTGGEEPPPEEEVVEEVVEETATVQVQLDQALERRLDCVVHYESGGDPSATNRSSKAAGLFQFLWSTWAGTPQGRAGRSPYDPLAAREAARWMFNQGRAREWVPVQRGLC